MNLIIGREKECEELTNSLKSNKPQLVGVYGRRRIGKTYLVENFYKNATKDPVVNKKIFYFDITATKKAKTSKMMERFFKKVNKDFSLKKKHKKPREWDEVFDLLIEGIDEKSNHYDKVVVFIDEFPWFQASNSSTFLDSFNNAWANSFSKNNKVIIAISGSSVTWLLKNVIYPHGELNDRITADIELKPFSLKETSEFLKHQGCYFDKKQTVELYICMGGIAEYLSKVKQNKSVHHNINDLFFTKNGFLKKEFKTLCEAHFDDFKYHKDILQSLSDSPEGVHRDELIEYLKIKYPDIKSSGTITQALEDLEKVGFITEKNFYGKKEYLKSYSISDPYLFFYFKWVLPFLKSKVNDDSYWLTLRQNESFNKWAGRAFENVCFLNIDLIKKAIGISGVPTTESTWKYIPKTGRKEQGSQIDLIISRSDAVHIIECKFYSSVWSVSKDDKENFLRKKKNFYEQNSIDPEKTTILTSLISVFGASEGDNFSDCFGHQYFADKIFF